MSSRFTVLLVTLTLLAGVASAQPPAMAPVLVPPPLALALLPSPPYPLDSRVAAPARDLMRVNAGCRSFGMNLYRWWPGDHDRTVVPYDLGVSEVSSGSSAQTPRFGNSASARAADEQRAVALRTLAAPLATSASALAATYQSFAVPAGESAAGVAVEAPMQGGGRVAFGARGPGYGAVSGGVPRWNWPCF